MANFRVWLWYSAGDSVEIEADSADEAIDKVYDDGPSGCGFDPANVEWEWEITEVEEAA